MGKTAEAEVTSRPLTEAEKVSIERHKNVVAFAMTLIESSLPPGEYRMTFIVREEVPPDQKGITSIVTDDEYDKVIELLRRTKAEEDAHGKGDRQIPGLGEGLGKEEK